MVYQLPFFVWDDTKHRERKGACCDCLKLSVTNNWHDQQQIGMVCGMHKLRKQAMLAFRNFELVPMLSVYLSELLSELTLVIN
jgi:hypothetical protein